MQALLRPPDVNNSSAARRSVVVELPLGETVGATFDLEKAVCSHGLFMMAPNQWDPLSKTFQRPLRLDSDDSAASTSVVVRISQPFDGPPHTLQLRVFDTDTLSPQQQRSLLEQVRRMLRLSEEDERNVREFWEIYGNAKKRGFGRLFRSPTLFEDMVKCILLCNCRWPRTLSMARALCELQLELRCLSYKDVVAEGTKLGSPTHETEHFAPKTPAAKDLKKRIGGLEKSVNLSERQAEVRAGREGDAAITVDSADTSKCLQEPHKRSRRSLFSNKEECYAQSDTCRTCTGMYEVSTSSIAVFQSSENTKLYDNNTGNFPNPQELMTLDENFLAKRCGLGYRASRILKLARSIVEGRIQLRQFEEDCGKASPSNYNMLAEQLKEIDGFGPYTCANVLMCMGFYHVIPSDTETIRHLRKVHGKRSTIRDIQLDIERIYGNYAPFQYLVYWSEIWSFYEERFGRLSELPESEYKLITAANLTDRVSKSKRTKNSRTEASCQGWNHELQQQSMEIQ